MSIDRFIKTPLGVEGAFTFTAVRNGGIPMDEHPDIIEFFNVVKNITSASMQQINVSRSKTNVIRGCHMSAFHKVVFCPTGRIYDVIVDLRPNSPTYKQWTGAWLSKDVHIYVPGFCAHGVLSAEDDSAISYYQGGTFFSHLDYAVNPLDPTFNIQWPGPFNGGEFILSEKDRNCPMFGPELEAKIRFRMENPIEDRLTTTNSDIVVAGKDMGKVIPIFEAIKSTELRGHHTVASALNRETLECVINSMRPKYSVIYLLDVKESEGPMDSFIEAMNVIHVCANLGNHLTLIINDPTFEAFESLIDLLKQNISEKLLVLVETCALTPQVSKHDIAQQLRKIKDGVITDYKSLSSLIVKMAIEQKTGQFILRNKGTVEMSKIIDYCQTQGVELPAPTSAENLSLPVIESIDETQEANEAFNQLISVAQE